MTIHGRYDEKSGLSGLNEPDIPESERLERKLKRIEATLDIVLALNMDILAALRPAPPTYQPTATITVTPKTSTL